MENVIDYKMTNLIQEVEKRFLLPVNEKEYKSYNKGEFLEFIARLFFTNETYYTKDKIPHTEAGDMTLNGEEINIKGTNAELVRNLPLGANKEKELEKYFKVDASSKYMFVLELGDNQYKFILMNEGQAKKFYTENTLISNNFKNGNCAIRLRKIGAVTKWLKNEQYI